MKFIVFNTVAKAKHYAKWYESKYEWDYGDESFEVVIEGNLVVLYHTYDEFCGSSEPENGYICCSGNYVTNKTVLGRIKS